MRSARTVSIVITITFGCSVAAAVSDGKNAKIQRIQERQLKERIREKGTLMLSESLGLRYLRRALEEELQSELHSPRRPLGDPRIKAIRCRDYGCETTRP